MISPNVRLANVSPRQDITLPTCAQRAIDSDGVQLDDVRESSSRIHHHVAKVWRAPGRMLTVSGIGHHRCGGNAYLWTMPPARHYGMCRLFVRLFEHETAKQVVLGADPTGDQRSPVT